MVMILADKNRNFEHFKLLPDKALFFKEIPTIKKELA